jgi:hypothetical protein
MGAVRGDGGELVSVQPQIPRTLNKHATLIIKGVYAQAAQPLEPHRILSNLARSMAIVGDLLGSLSDQYFKAGKKYTSILAASGRMLWGIVELSVPGSTGFYLMRHWLKLATTVAVAIIVLGAIFGVSAIVPFGWKLLAAILAIAILRSFLHGYMITSKWPTKLIVSTLALAAVGVLIWLVLAQGDKMGHGLIWLHQLPQYLLDQWHKMRCACK